MSAVYTFFPIKDGFFLVTFFLLKDIHTDSPPHIHQGVFPLPTKLSLIREYKGALSSTPNRVLIVAHVFDFQPRHLERSSLIFRTVY